MNFCGMDQRNVVDTESEMDMLLPRNNFHCGGCVKGVVLQEEDEDIETFLDIDKQLSPVSTASSSNDHELTTPNIEGVTSSSINHHNTTPATGTSSTSNSNSSLAKKPVAQIALDNIQLAIEEEHTYRDSKSITVSDVVNVNDLYVDDDDDADDDDDFEESREDVELDTDNVRDEVDTAIRDQIHHLAVPPSSTTDDNSYPYSIAHTSSPCLLNPLDFSQWSETREGIELMHRRPELSCPILDNPYTATSPSHETLLRRFEQGFHVRPVNNDIAPEHASCASLIGIYLHPDRSRICFGPMEMVTSTTTDNMTNRFGKISPRYHQRRSWYTNDVSFIPNHRNFKNVKHQMEILVTDILRLEIGGQNTKSFSIIACKQESGYIDGHAFEATCVIDREVVVSTLLLLLDQAHHSQMDSNENEQEILENDNGTFDWIEGTDGGTMDKPIPCSPSLDEPIEIHNVLTDEQSIIHCSPSVETERIQNSYHYVTDNAQRQQQIPLYGKLTMSTATEEEESGDVIHLEDISITDSNVSRVVGNWSRRTPSSLCLVQQKSMSVSEEVEEVVRLDCKASASTVSTQVYGGNSNSTTATANNISQAVWCSGDTCALALNDIAETCTGIFALKQNESICSTALGVDQRVAVEEFIATALGTSTDVYSYLTEGGDIWSSKASIPDSNAKAGKIHRNRATILNAQAVRLRVLRNEMTFATALKQSREKMQFVQTVQSFDDAYNRAGTKRLRAATEAANRLHSSPLLKSIVNNMRMHDEQGNTKIDDDASSNVVYYDSDPEDSRPHNADKGPRKIVQVKEGQRNGEVENPNGGITPPLPTRTLVGMEDVITPMKISKKLDEETIVEIVQTMNNERLTLMWHPTQDQTSQQRHRSLSPQCVKVWIEAGVYLNDGTFLLPKLTWTKVSAVLASGKPAVSEQTIESSLLQAKIQYSPTLEKLDLLDICRIYPLATVNRKLHPFALTQKSFCIETQNERFVFQAQTIDEKDRIVYGLKLVVARLASLLMLRDIRAAEEFFGAITTTNPHMVTVPGQAPTWNTTIMKGDHNSNSSTTTNTHHDANEVLLSEATATIDNSTLQQQQSAVVATE